MINKRLIEYGNKKDQANRQPITRGLASGGALSHGTLRRILGVHLPSEPLRNPARTPSPRHVIGKHADRAAGQ